MSTETTSATQTETPDPMVHIDRAMFARIEEQQQTVALTDGKLRAAAEAHKDAKKDHENALETLKALVGAMIRRVNGEPEGAPLPLFDNQTDAIESALADPAVSTFVARMTDHGLSWVNALIVAGYDAAQREELGRYLDALDLREAALANGEPVEAIDVPAFLIEPEPEEITDQQVVDALAVASVVMKKKHIRLMSHEQRAAVLAYSAEFRAVNERLGEAVTFDDLPTAPSFVVNPKELEAVAVDSETADGDEARTPESAPKPKKPRAPRRSSAQFTNTPKLAGTVKKAKGAKRRQAVN